MKKKKNNYLFRTVCVIICLLVLLFLEWVFTGQSIVVGIDNGSCIHDKLAVIIFDTGRYISMISIVTLIVLTIIFKNKSNKFFIMLLLVSIIFVFVIPIGFSMKSSNIRNNDICRGSLWNSKYCQMKNGECIKEVEVDKYE